MKKILLFAVICLLVLNNLTVFSAGWRQLIDKSTFDVVVNPLNYNTIYAGGEGRTIYRSYDGGKNWDTLAMIFRSGGSRLNNMIMHPKDTNIIVAGGLLLNDLMRTTDNGQNWDIVLPRTTSVNLNGKSLMEKPDAPDTMYAGDFTSSIFFRSTNKGATWDSLVIVMDTVKWTDSTGVRDTLLPVPIGSTGIRTDSTNIMLMGSTNGKIYITTDGGFNWKRTATLVAPKDPNDCEVTRIAFSNRDPKYGYACITYLFHNNLPNGGAYQTTDGGYNWHRIGFADTSLWTIACRKFGENDEIFIGGYTEQIATSDSAMIPGVGIVRRSYDGGKSWINYDSEIDWAIQPKDNRENSTFNSLVFSGRDTGMVVGSFGKIIKTTDGGRNWNDIIYNFTSNYKSVFLTTDTTVFMTDSEGLILFSKKGGYSWDTVYKLVKPKSLNFITFVDKRTGFVAGDSGTILKTTDGGTVWLNKSIKSIENYKYIHFFDLNNGLIVGTNGKILITYDGGDTWQTQNSGVTEDLNSAWFINPDTGYVVGKSGKLLYTTNKGVNWKIIPSQTNLSLNSIYFLSKDNGFVVGDSGLMYKIINGVVIPNQIQRVTHKSLTSILFSTPDTGWVICKFGSMIATTNGGQTWSVGPYWGAGPRANMWSQRYFGPPGQEKIYMATEAGFFVIDDLKYVEEIRTNEKDKRLIVHYKAQGLINIKYLLRNPGKDGQLVFRLIDLNGNVVLQKSQFSDVSDFVNEDIQIPKLAKGMYACQMIENGATSTQMVIIY